MSLELLGAEAPAGGYGDFIGPILQAAGGLAQGGISIYEQHQAEQTAAAAKQKATADEAAAARAAISADVTATLASARAQMAAQLKQASAAVDREAAQIAAQAQDEAGAGLTSAASKQRVDAARAALSTAAKKAQASPKDVYLVCLMRAWTATLNKAGNRQIASTTNLTPGAGQGGPSWFTRPVLGPVPGWGVLAGGAVTATGLGLLLRRFL